jgi:hypothetical protein
MVFLTAIASISGNLNKNSFLHFLLILLTGTHFSAKAQGHWSLHWSRPASGIDQVSTDPYFNFYYSDVQGNIFRFDSTGTSTGTFSSKRKGVVTLLDATRNVNVFAFYAASQEYRLLNRFLTETSTASIKNTGTGYARIVSPSNDNNLWIIDDNDLSLKKFNLQFNKNEVNTPLPLVIPSTGKDLDIVYLREFENNLYISDRNNGIWVFDNLGNYKTKIPAYHNTHFSFLENRIYFLENDQLVFVDLRTRSRTEYKLPENLKISRILISETKAFLSGADQFHFYTFTP